MTGVRPAMLLSYLFLVEIKEKGFSVMVYGRWWIVSWRLRDIKRKGFHVTYCVIVAERIFMPRPKIFESFRKPCGRETRKSRQDTPTYKSGSRNAIPIWFRPKAYFWLYKILLLLNLRRQLRFYLSYDILMSKGNALDSLRSCFYSASEIPSHKALLVSYRWYFERRGGAPPANEFAGIRAVNLKWRRKNLKKKPKKNHENS